MKRSKKKITRLKISRHVMNKYKMTNYDGKISFYYFGLISNSLTRLIIYIYFYQIVEKENLCKSYIDLKYLPESYLCFLLFLSFAYK